MARWVLRIWYLNVVDPFHLKFSFFRHQFLKKRRICTVFEAKAANSPYFDAYMAKWASATCYSSVPNPFHLQFLWLRPRLLKKRWKTANLAYFQGGGDECSGFWCKWMSRIWYLNVLGPFHLKALWFRLQLLKNASKRWIQPNFEAEAANASYFNADMPRWVSKIWFFNVLGPFLGIWRSFCRRYLR